MDTAGDDDSAAGGGGSQRLSGPGVWNGDGRGADDEGGVSALGEGTRGGGEGEGEGEGVSTDGGEMFAIVRELVGNWAVAPGGRPATVIARAPVKPLRAWLAKA